ncbi:tRNA lysidine(34) synthetase TilS [Paracoccus siganidrum]|uniref:tRNA(Ile)-lysidine synthase n=1 Tax=Paracoccus siganidrum TaxID=1276757 RepID=A0A419ABE1_9RHOB|nr:tRNA lysidine(34) synthetase TilS [Paracoccus siganidrum]RJL20862.1 tRNA lysidine(34) synthetase TilS [Paracoccus siganidrum]RMC34038.1 tRNA lysidine(34) synthetase TilS [Paracoccus siganidrum]
MTAPPRDPAARIRAALDRLAGDMPSLGVAVSGGGDSVALMRIIAEWARGRRIMVATVDHGLRPESEAEARQVGQAARALGLPHAALLWQRETEAGNLMAHARDARLRLLSAWAQRNELAAVALGHTADDQAETLMMRLARGSGIDGLAAMTEWRDAFGIRWLRPMLGVGRDELRDWLRARDIPWIEDPSNEKEEFERIRIRNAIAAMGLDIAALARAAAHIGEARDALSHYAALASQGAIIRNGALILPRRPFSDAPAEIRRRLLVAGCRWITGADYPPRRATLLHALNAMAAGSRVTLDGALIEPAGDRIRLSREPAAAMRAEPSEGPLWDNRWRITGLRPGQHVAALGLEALAQVNWRLSGLPRDEAAASPAIWQGGRLIAAPLLRPAPPLRVSPLRGATEFRRLVMAH